MLLAEYDVNNILMFAQKQPPFYWLCVSMAILHSILRVR